MRKWLEEVAWAAGKARDLVQLDADLLRARELSVGDRVRLAAERYRAMAQDTHQLRYLGRRFYFDNRLMPALMPAYLTEIRTLDRLVDLSHATVLDIGANVGQFGATISWRFPHAEVWSFEPNEEIYPILRENAAQSPNWRTVPWGVGRRDEAVSFWVVPGKSGQGSTIRENATVRLRAESPSEHIVHLRAITIDRMGSLGIPARVDLVKVDVEGAEASVILGLSQVRWRFLAVETSLARTGGLTVAETVDLVGDTWGAYPEVIWTSPPKLGAATVDAVLAMPGEFSGA